MPRVRAINKKYGISKHAFMCARSYCLQYQEWKEQLEAITSTIKSPVIGIAGAHGNSDATAALAMKREKLKEKIANIEESAKAAAIDQPGLYPYLLEYVTTEEATFRMMEFRGIPCGRTYFYQMRRRFYYIIAKKI